MTGSKENARVKADELLKLISGSTCPQPISIAMFAQRVVSLCVNSTGSPNSAVYAYCHVVVHVTSKVPLAMDILIAELNKVCIYTVPKHIINSEAAFQTKEAHFKAIGYAEKDGKIENTDSYVDRLSAYMKLYGDLVQMAGFVLHKRYKTQFRKLLDIIAKEFLIAFEDRGNTKLMKLTENIQSYIESNQFLNEPVGGRLKSSLDSNIFTPDSDHDQ